MKRQDALEMLYSSVTAYLGKGKFSFGLLSRRTQMGRVFFNNEYPLDLPLEAIALLWPEARNDKALDD